MGSHALAVTGQQLRRLAGAACISGCGFFSKGKNTLAACSTNTYADRPRLVCISYFVATHPPDHACVDIPALVISSRDSGSGTS